MQDKWWLQSDVDFLKQIINLFPEVKYLLDSTEPSPENNNSNYYWAEQLFDSQGIQTAQELERGVTALLCFKYVMAGDYESFTQPQKNGKLTKASFQKLRQWSDPAQFDSDFLNLVFYSILLNDLGKTITLTQAYHDLYTDDLADHDQIMYRLLSEQSNLFPGFQKFTTSQKKFYIQSLATNFNLGQLVQGEAPAYSLQSLLEAPFLVRKLHLLHNFYDVCGAAGQVQPVGSLIMTETVFQNYNLAITSLETSPDAVTSYNSYLQHQQQKLGLPDIALTRIALMARLSPAEGSSLKAIWQRLPVSAVTILNYELNLTGFQDRAILPYYGPAFLNQIKKRSLEDLYGGMIILAQAFQHTRIEVVKTNTSPGVTTFDFYDLVNTDLSYLKQNLIQAVKVGSDLYKLKLDLKDKIELPVTANIVTALPPPTEPTMYVGIGGGSDVMQAAQLALLTSPNTKKILVSIRGGSMGSEVVAGEVGQERTILNHGGEVFPGVYRVTKETTSRGRFMEPLLVPYFTTYVILDRNLEQQLAYLQNYHHIQHIIGVDTGGDSLCSPDKSAPDQDFVSLQALQKLKVKSKQLAIIALGVDSPDNSGHILSQVEASSYSLDAQQSQQILQQYEDWDMTGQNPQRYGKTSLSWQHALRGELGLQSLALPSNAIRNDNNPWSPFVVINAIMQKVLMLEVDKLLSLLT